MKDILAFVGIQVVLDFIESLTLDDIFSIIAKVCTLIFAIVLFAVKYRKAKADGKITNEEREELKQAAQETFDFAVVGLAELKKLVEELEKTEKEKKE